MFPMNQKTVKNLLVVLTGVGLAVVTYVVYGIIRDASLLSTKLLNLRIETLSMMISMVSLVWVLYFRATNQVKQQKIALACCALALIVLFAVP